MASAKKVVILGGGISGLASALTVKNLLPGAMSQVTVVESSHRVGGWIHSHPASGAVPTGVLESGCRSFRPGTPEGLKMLEWIFNNNLHSGIIPCSALAGTRYLYDKGSVRALGPNPYTLGILLPGLFREWKQASDVNSDDSFDETVDSFFRRRLGDEVAESVVDAVISGIYAGSTRHLSMRTVMPTVLEMERKHGSLTSAGVARWRESRSTKHVEPITVSNDPEIFELIRKSASYSFRDGADALPRAIHSELNKRKGFETLLGTRVTQLKPLEGNGGATRVTMQGCGSPSHIDADVVISALPAHVLSAILPDHMNDLSRDLSDIRFTTVAVVNVTYAKEDVIRKHGFGYLIPSRARQDAIGVVFDSCVFPDQNISDKESRLTVMIGGENHPDKHNLKELEYEDIALGLMRNHLGIVVDPTEVRVNVQRSCIPQYGVGHQEKLARIEKMKSILMPNVFLCGNSYKAVSVNDCVVNAIASSEEAMSSVNGEAHS